MDEEHVLTGASIRRLLYRRDVAMARHRASVARALGLTDAEMQALIHLAEQGELAPSTIGGLLDLSSGGATALIQRLERSGHVTRHPHPTDRRSTLIALSPRTAKRLEDALTPLDSGLDSVTAPLTERERTTVAGVLAQVASLTEELAAALRRDADRLPDVAARPVPSLWS